MPVKTTTPEDTMRMRVLTRLIRDSERPKRRRRSNPKPLEHGTRTAYNRHRCRCEQCRTANREYLQALAARPKGVPQHLHGTVNAYDHLGCRCAACRTASSAARMRRHHGKSKCHAPKCQRSFEPDGRRKYCSEQCRIAVNGY